MFSSYWLFLFSEWFANCNIISCLISNAVWNMCFKNTCGSVVDIILIFVVLFLETEPKAFLYAMPAINHWNTSESVFKFLLWDISVSLRGLDWSYDQSRFQCLGIQIVINLKFKFTVMFSNLSDTVYLISISKSAAWQF